MDNYDKNFVLALVLFGFPTLLFIEGAILCFLYTLCTGK